MRPASRPTGLRVEKADHSAPIVRRPQAEVPFFPGKARSRRRVRMKFIRIGDETIRLDLITHVKEGCKEETLYGRSVRKTTDHRFGWLEVHFVSGEVLKIEGEGTDVLRRILEEATGARAGRADPHPRTETHRA